MKKFKLVIACIVVFFIISAGTYGIYYINDLNQCVSFLKDIHQYQPNQPNYVIRAYAYSLKYGKNAKPFFDLDDWINHNIKHIY